MAPRLIVEVHRGRLKWVLALWIWPLAVVNGTAWGQSTPLPPLPSRSIPKPTDDVPTPHRRIVWGRPTAEPVDGAVRRVRLFQDPAETAPDSAAPGAPTPDEPTTPDLSVPAADRSLGGGEATDTSQAAEEATGRGEPWKLQAILGLADSPVKVYGWIQNSFTGNANGFGNGLNFGVNPNYKANQWMGNQYYVVVEDPIEQTDQVNLGFRVDNIFGNDWQFNYIQGMFNRAFERGQVAAYDMGQLYGEIHLPDPTGATRGIDVKGGRWYTIAGYEQVPAIARPLLSVPYMMNYGPFTHVGVLTTWHLTDKINLYNGSINGWDRWINIHYQWGYIGGFSWTGNEDRTTLAVTAIWGPNQFPRFLPADQPIYPTGYINIPSVAGTNNPGYNRNGRFLFTSVLTHKWTDRLTQVLETDQGGERSVPGLASKLNPATGDTPYSAAAKSAQWQSFGNWFLWRFNDRLTGVWRSEIFWDQQGARTSFHFNSPTRGDRFVGDRFYEQTLGLIYKPIPNLWIRPEARYDWSQFHPAYTDGTRKSQLTLGFDVIWLF